MQYELDLTEISELNKLNKNYMEKSADIGRESVDNPVSKRQKQLMDEVKILELELEL